MYRTTCIVLVATALVLSPVNAFVGGQFPGLVSKPSALSHNAALLKSNRMALRSFKMQEQQTDVQEEVQESVVPPPPAPMNQAGPVGWFEKTTVQDRSLRVGGDPLAPKINPTQTQMSQRRAQIEEDGYNWYKSQESKRSMFGRTLNPLTGALEDPDENAQALNPFEDPIFYVILIVGSPVVLMVGAAYACVVPALSVAFGAQCEW